MSWLKQYKEGLLKKSSVHQFRKEPKSLGKVERQDGLIETRNHESKLGNDNLSYLSS